MLLKIVGDEEAIITLEDIHYYDDGQFRPRGDDGPRHRPCQGLELPKIHWIEAEEMKGLLIDIYPVHSSQANESSRTGKSLLLAPTLCVGEMISEWPRLILCDRRSIAERISADQGDL